MIFKVYPGQKHRIKYLNDVVSIIWNYFYVSRQLIYNYPEQLFADAGVMAIEHADFEGVERLALVTGLYISHWIPSLFKILSTESLYRFQSYLHLS